jgi:HD superfamily phosphohydrolase YqeK
LHDISVVFPNYERIRVSKALGIEVLLEEEIFPLIIHQKISKVMALEIFKIQDETILNAIGCHTTLRSTSTKLDRVLFVADKIEWDQRDSLKVVHPWLEDAYYELKTSLNL